MHALVNAFGKGGSAMTEEVKKKVGQDTLREAANLQGVKVGHKDNSVGETLAKYFIRDNFFAVEHSPTFESPQILRKGTRVRIAYDDDDAPLTKRRWFYGVITAIDDRQELVSVDFDNGEELRSTPLFDVHFVAAPEASKRQRTRR